ncbi:restriction endonuclease subunit S [Agarivorans albus]|uniref:Type I restriction-modification system n=1 Tax=Agarivorans albus MKT 106 TaxID=1331007 RepID=R9PMT7_AGAAL|nr:restriction endonuclease subunit S [Agarivorans albus]GAD02669.1 type I restriction-modification system [Agarivorans albus MKT 106]
MSQLPEGWVEKTFDEIGEYTDFVANGSFASLKENVTQTDKEDYAILLRLKDHSKGFKGPFKYVTKPSYEFLKKSELQAGDLFLANVGAPGRTFLVPELGKPMTIAPNGIRVRANDLTSNRFIDYFIRSRQGQDLVLSITGGNAQQKFNKTALKKSKFPLPPLDEQKRIADKLDSVLAKVETAQAHLDKIPTILKRFRQSVLAAATSGELTKDWRGSNGVEGWEKVRLKDVGKGFNYGSSSKSQPEGKIPVLRMGNLQGGKLDWEKLVFTSDDAEIEKYKLHPGDVLFNRTNSPELVGKTSIYRGEREAIFAGYLIKVQGTNRLNTEYLNIQLNSPHARDYCWAVKTDGVSQSNINAKKLQAYEFELPSIEEQIEIIRVVTELLSSADLVEKQYKATKLRVDKMTQSILARAFSGKLFSPISEEDRTAVTVKAHNSESQQTKHKQPKAIAKEPERQTEVVSATVNESSNEQASEVFQLLKMNSKGMSAQALFDAQSENTFNAIDDLFTELKKLIEQKVVIQASEGENSTFKVTKK